LQRARIDRDGGLVLDDLDDRGLARHRVAGAVGERAADETQARALARRELQRVLDEEEDAEIDDSGEEHEEQREDEGELDERDASMITQHPGDHGCASSDAQMRCLSVLSDDAPSLDARCTEPEYYRPARNNSEPGSLGLSMIGEQIR